MIQTTVFPVKRSYTISRNTAWYKKAINSFILLVSPEAVIKLLNFALKTKV